MVQGNSHNIPQRNAAMQPRDQQYAQPKKQAKEPCNHEYNNLTMGTFDL